MWNDVKENDCEKRERSWKDNRIELRKEADLFLGFELERENNGNGKQFKEERGKRMKENEEESKRKKKRKKNNGLNC